MPPAIHHLSVSRTARYLTLGQLTDDTREIWLVLHGYGQLATEFLSHFTELDDGSRFFIAPEGLSRFYARGLEGRPVASWMTSEDREAEIKDYINYLDDLYTHLRLHWYHARLVLLGFSQGVATATRWLAESNRTADVVVACSGSIAEEHRQPLPDKFRKGPMWVYITAASDPLITPEQHRQARELMGELKAHVLDFEGGHELRSDMLVKAAQLIRERTGKKRG